MNHGTGKKRTDSASKIVQATPRTLYEAFVDPQAMAAWLPPEGMKGRIYEFDARSGGAYRMSLTYAGADHSTPGKTSAHEDVVKGRFLALDPYERVVQLAEFESHDPAFAGEMTVTWSFAEAPEGTLVKVLCEDVPEGIRKEDHDEGLKSSLDNLAAYVEGKV